MCRPVINCGEQFVLYSTRIHYGRHACILHKRQIIRLHQQLAIHHVIMQASCRQKQSNLAFCFIFFVFIFLVIVVISNLNRISIHFSTLQNEQSDLSFCQKQFPWHVVWRAMVNNNNCTMKANFKRTQTQGECCHLTTMYY